MGKESYGLVGIFTTLQVLFQVLDVGFSQTLIREVARYRGGAVDVFHIKQLVRAMELALGIGAVSFVTIFLLLAPRIASRWLHVQDLPESEVVFALRLMAGVAGLRLASLVYRSTITGAEDQVWLNGFAVTSCTFRNVGVFAPLWGLGASAVVFFSYQLVLALLEVFVLARRADTLLPVQNSELVPRLSLSPLIGIGKFAITVALTSTIWMTITYLDRFLLSRKLSLINFGYYSIALTVASTVTLVSAPLSNALLPRLSKLAAENNEVELLRLYCRFTRLVCGITLPVAVTVALFPAQILGSWTGNLELAHYVALPVTFYSLGNAIFIIAAFPYYLQYSKGDLRLHLWGNLFFVALYVPLLAWLIVLYGPTGAAVSWATVNLIYLIAWAPVVHRRLVPGLHFKWLVRDILVPSAVIVIAGAILCRVPVESSSRVNTLVRLSLIAVTMLATGSTVSGGVYIVIETIRKYLGKV